MIVILSNCSAFSQVRATFKLCRNMPMEAYVERAISTGIRPDFQAVLLLRGSQGLQAAATAHPMPLSGIAFQVAGCK